MIGTMREIIQIKDTKHEDAFIGYAEEVTAWLKEQLFSVIEEISICGIDIDVVKTKYPYVRIMVHVIDSLESPICNVKNNNVLIEVWNVMEDGMNWKVLNTLKDIE